DVISEDIARAAPADATGAVAPTRAAQHWANTGRILNAAAWVATAPPRVHLVQITSFGCGPDAFVIDEIGELLRHAGKSHTVLKVDDINNNGSLRLRVRSLLESLPRPKASAPAAPTCAADGTDGNGTDAPAADGTNATTRFTEADRHRTILVPFFSETYSPFIPVLLGLMGYKAHSLPPADAESIDHGLRHANNEVCYPATLVIGDFLRALASGDYARDQIALGLTQTGGQCRASSYLALLKRALHNAGYADVPVVSFGTASGAVVNEQPGFHPRWRGNIRAFITGIIYADHIAQMYYATAPREALADGAARLRDSYIAAGAAAIGRRDITALRHLLRRAAADFNGATAPDAAPVPRIGIVGEIYIKYNSVGNKNIVEWLITQGVEPVVPPLIDFFLQEIPNRTYNRRAHLAHRTWLDWLDAIGYRLTRHYQKQLAADASGFRHHHAGEDIYTKAQAAARILSPAAQYGEGWLIAAELAGFAESGVPNAVCLQPFGCIANHLVAKGIERRVRELYPRMNLLFLDLDSGTGEANLLNRLHFIVQNARDCAGDTEAANVGDFSHS
ncbi:MAG: 2-hydroxyacyl-CoA dehydratase, partial [Puniceicoccales bacterium]|nr:2-hydroxyacyl-CoA dehydratase [Puniceicoccales bacterium]